MTASHHRATAEHLADLARARLQAHWQTALEDGQPFEDKDDASPVTAIDRAIERELREAIARHTPSFGVVGEEYPDHQRDAEYSWVLDPIDGTKAFIAGVPVYGTLIALCRDGRPVLGVVDLPIAGLRWVGVEGQPTRLNGQPVRTRPCTELARALLASSNPESLPDTHLAAFARLRDATRWRLYGAACSAYANLARGRIDLVADGGGMAPVDYCALVPVIEGAGGVISDWQGRPLGLGSGSSVLAAGDPQLHRQALERLHQA